VKAATDISDGELVRLACAGDPVAFRLLVERHRPAALARARYLARGASATRSGDAEDVVQDAFLQAFVALDRLQDPDRFAGWLSGIVLNTYRAARRRQDRTDLVGEWSEDLHPISADGLPEAALDDLDRGDAVAQAVAGLSGRQQEAVRMFYFADLPVGQIADQLDDSPGAVKARLHQARRRLREHITVHRPDLVPYLPQRTPMTTVRIAYVGPRNFGTAGPGHLLVVLADDAASRALPLWLRRFEGNSLAGLLERPPGREGLAWYPEELTDRLLRAAGASVAAVEIGELGPGVTAARIDVTGPAGSQQVTVRPGDGLALAVAAGAPIRVPDALMDRLAEPVPDGDLPGPFADRVPVPNAPSGIQVPDSPQYEARNLDFTAGLDGWRLSGTFQRDLTVSHGHDYAATAGPGAASAVLRAAVAEPSGRALLGQTIRADGYRRQQVSFAADLRPDRLSRPGQSGMFLQVSRDPGRSAARTSGPAQQGGNTSLAAQKLAAAQAGRAPQAEGGLAGLAAQAGLTLSLFGRDQNQDQGPGSQDQAAALHNVDIGEDRTAGPGWRDYQVSAYVPDDAAFITFGIALTGRGEIEIRGAAWQHAAIEGEKSSDD
jgi:RNA polymerase sigma-70 factor (ECF subfamily)